jgi:putative nucleotidyltransferase with HDIG domain
MRDREYDRPDLEAMEIPAGTIEDASAVAYVRGALAALKPPPLPEVAVALAALARQAGADLREAEIVVSRDPHVAAKIVALANSPTAKGGPAIRSLGSAISRLGLSAVRDAAFLVTAEARLFKAPGYGERMAALSEAAQMSGLIAREVCLQLGLQAEHAYLCGLLHDVGEAVVLSAVGELKRTKNRAFAAEDVDRAVALYHAEAGARACAAWDLPDEIVDAVRFHHAPEGSESTSAMAGILAVVDVLLRHIGVGGEAKPIARESERVFLALKLVPEQIRRLTVSVERIALNDGAMI